MAYYQNQQPGGGYPNMRNDGYPLVNQPGYPGAQQDPYYQNNAGGYPQIPPADVHGKIPKKKKGKDKSSKYQNALEDSDSDGEGQLDCIPKLMGDNNRQNFVVKVFGIMTVQTIFTALFTYWIISDEKKCDFVQENMWLYFVCVGVTLVIMCALM